MFEEVPRGRRGLAGLSARRIALGPFVIGGGMLLAMVGGSVAVAATVITASTIVGNDLPPKHAVHTAIGSASSRPSHSPAQASGRSRSAAASASQSTGRSDRLSGPGVLTSATTTPSPSHPALTAAEPSTTAAPITLTPAAPGLPASSGSLGSPGSSGSSGSTKPSGPVGNALIYVTGYDSVTSRLVFEYASVQRGAGVNGSDLYSVNNPAEYSVYIATGISITSGGRICPPAGSSCTVAQLIEAAGGGFFANAAIDPSAELQSIVELDNAAASPQLSLSGIAPQPSPNASPSTSPSVTPPADSGS